MAADAAYIHSNIIAQNLRADHRHGLRLGWVDFSWHDAGTRFVFGKHEFANAATGAGCRKADVACNMHQAYRKGFQSSGSFHAGIMSRKGFKFIWGGDERKPRKPGNFFCDQFIIPFGSIQASANSSPAKCKFGKMGEGIFQGPQAMIELGHISREFLAKGKGGCIHEVGAAGFNYVFKLFGFLCQGIPEPFHSRNGSFYNHLVCSYAHCSRKSIVGRL